MAIWSLTKEKIERLLQQAADKEKELLALLELTPNQIWNTDLDRFLEEWEKACQEWEEKGVVDSSGKKVKRKQVTLKTRKSIGGGSGPGKRIGGGDSDGDDDFTKKSATAAKARSKPIAPKLLPLFPPHPHYHHHCPRCRKAVLPAVLPLASVPPQILTFQ